MSAPTPEDLDKLRASNEKLREQIVEQTSTKADREAEAAREVEFIQLQAEEVRLKAQLAAVKDAAKVGNVKAGSAGLLESAKAQLEQAQAQAEQPLGPVDTTVGEPVNVSDTTKGPAATSTTPDEPKKGSDS